MFKKKKIFFKGFFFFYHSFHDIFLKKKLHKIQKKLNIKKNSISSINATLLFVFK